MIFFWHFRIKTFWKCLSGVVAEFTPRGFFYLSGFCFYFGRLTTERGWNHDFKNRHFDNRVRSHSPSPKRRSLSSQVIYKREPKLGLVGKSIPHVCVSFPQMTWTCQLIDRQRISKSIKMFCLRCSEWTTKPGTRRSPGRLDTITGRRLSRSERISASLVCRNFTAGREAIEHRKHFPICILNLSMERCADRARRSRVNGKSILTSFDGAWSETCSLQFRFQYQLDSNR